MYFNKSQYVISHSEYNLYIHFNLCLSAFSLKSKALFVVIVFGKRNNSNMKK